MSQVETDIVLSAIRRGEDSLPKLRAATGLEYAKLHPVLHTLEFEWRSIQRNETADGFSRYVPMPSERAAPLAPGTVHTISPQAFVRTNAAETARQMAILQRDAPYCVTCHGLCILHGTDSNSRVRWRCKPCNITFAGSGAQSQMNRIGPEKRQQAVAALKDGKSIRTVAAEVGLAKHTVQRIREDEKIEALCPCGQDAKHQGWCSHRFQNSPARQATVAKMNMAYVDPHEDDRPSLELGPDEERALESMRDEEEPPAEIKIMGSAPNDLCGCGFSAKHRGRCADGQPKSTRMALKTPIVPRAGNGTRPKTKPEQPERAQEVKPDKIADKRYGPFCDANCFPGKSLGHHKDCAYWKEEEARRSATARHQTSDEEPKHAIEAEKAVTATTTFLDKNWKFPPSALLKKIVMNDDYFPEAYDVLIGILDTDMSAEEQAAVWTLLRYLKRVEKSNQEAWLCAEIEASLNERDAAKKAAGST